MIERKWLIRSSGPNCSLCVLHNAPPTHTHTHKEHFEEGSELTLTVLMSCGVEGGKAPCRHCEQADGDREHPGGREQAEGRLREGPAGKSGAADEGSQDVR